jgi:hypothetical protein
MGVARPKVRPLVIFLPESFASEPGLRPATRPARARNAIEPTTIKGTNMAERAGNERPTATAGLRDFLALGVRAAASGLAVALTLAFAALVLAHNAQAAGKAPASDASGGARLFYAVDPIVAAAAAPAFHDTIVVDAARGNEPWSAAPAPTGPTRPAGTGALWATAIKAQGDSVATLLLLLGLFALGAAAIVAVIGRDARGTHA